jgi:hypothetical protein
VGALQFLKQGRHRRPVVKDHDMIARRWRLLGEAGFEALFEKRDQVDGKTRKTRNTPTN